MLYEGDCLEVLRTMPDGSVDAVVTDPPYDLTPADKRDYRRGYPHRDGEGEWSGKSRDGQRRKAGGFMGKEWDGQGVAFRTDLWAEVLRVLKPGGHLIAFGGTRTYHRMACAIEDAGFEIRDSLSWVYGQGFPKSHNVAKVLPASPEWEGWGTALKPSHEPIVLARKPLVGTVAANVLAFGTGAVNVDGCRVPSVEPNPSIARRKGATNHCKPGEYHEVEGRWTSRSHPATFAAPHSGEQLGRWPANLLLTHSAACNGTCAPDCPVAALDAQSGVLKSGAVSQGVTRKAPSMFNRDFHNAQLTGYGDTGTASRFFPCFTWEPEYDAPFYYSAKASRRERNAGCGGLPEQVYAASGSAQGAQKRGEAEYMQDSIGLNRIAMMQNHHPTVKPVALMRWLVRLVTPPGGLVLDPFTGSGTTGVAALVEGFRFAGIEREAEYMAIARARIGAAQAAARQAEFITEGGAA